MWFHCATAAPKEKREGIFQCIKYIFSFCLRLLKIQELVAFQFALLLDKPYDVRVGCFSVLVSSVYHGIFN